MLLLSSRDMPGISRPSSSHIRELFGGKPGDRSGNVTEFASSCCLACGDGVFFDE
jgi:hypothetical protein